MPGDAGHFYLLYRGGQLLCAPVRYGCGPTAWRKSSPLRKSLLAEATADFGKEIFTALRMPRIRGKSPRTRGS